MSLTSWINEFYPVQSLDCPTDNVAMLKHAILKWQGALPDNLKKHKMEYSGCACVKEINPGNSGMHWEFFYNAQSCALCLEYYPEDDIARDDTSEVVEPLCEGCPLYAYQGFSCCYGTDDVDPYAIFMEGNGPMVMIKYLEACLEIEQKSSPAGAKEKE